MAATMEEATEKAAGLERLSAMSLSKGWIHPGDRQISRRKSLKHTFAQHRNLIKKRGNFFEFTVISFTKIWWAVQVSNLRPLLSQGLTQGGQHVVDVKLVCGGLHGR